MPYSIEDLMNVVNSYPELTIGIGTAIAALLLYSGVASAIRNRNPAAARIASMNTRRQARLDRGLLKPADLDPRGMMKHFMPSDEEERSKLQLKLWRAGLTGPRALQTFFIVRVLLGLILPAALLVVLYSAKLPNPPLPSIIVGSVATISHLRIFQLIAILVAAGYFLPLKWLNDRVEARSKRIERGFPNALDLLQVSLEAGLGFDAAMTRVGNELASVSPDLASEFLTVQRQIQAGRGRDVALRDMADRTGVDTIRAFANVVQQSVQFGTPMNEAMAVYAKEMREYREMRAQEMANKLPVKMSAVLASLMLPALILLTIGPTVIRYIRAF